MFTPKRPFRSADEKLKFIEDKLNVGTWIWDLENSEVIWSRGMYKILGYDPATVFPSIDLYQTLIHPEDQLDFTATVGLASSEILLSRRLRLIRPDGSMRWIYSQTQRHFDVTGHPSALIGVVADITHEEILAENLESEIQRNKAIREVVDGEIWSAMPDGKLIDTASWSQLTGETVQEARDWDKLSAIHPDDRGMFRKQWELARSNKENFTATIRVRKLDGTYVTTTNRAVPLRNAVGQIEQWIGFSRLGPDPALGPDSRPGNPKRDNRALQASQLRAARTLLGWSAAELAQLSGLSFSTIRRMEQSANVVRGTSLQKVLATFAAAGLVISRDAGGTVSITLRVASD